MARDSKECITREIARHSEFTTLDVTVEKIFDTAAQLIAEGKVIGWFQGGSELGPRALGHRSILADPRDPDMRDYLNDKVKHRETFRPFAPVVLEERTGDYFDTNKASPFMLLVADVKASKRALLPAVTHVDGTARLQTINADQDEKLYSLIKSFDELTGIPVLLNTSFNDKGEPIVETPEDALRAFGHMKLDALVLGDNILVKR